MERLKKCMNDQGRKEAGGEDERGAGNSGNNMDTRGEDRMRRLDVPYFTGEDLYGWIYRAERCFQINKRSQRR